MRIFDMKSTNTRVVVQKALPILLMVLGLFLSGTTSLWAQDVDDGIERGVFGNYAVGSFDGVNLKERRIWIDDTLYALDRSVQVEGTSTKLGLLSDLKQGETIKASFQPNEKEPGLHIVTVIERL
jgi:hypothetical protein